MAKNLKLNIKNTQLAKALQLKQAKAEKPPAAPKSKKVATKKVQPKQDDQAPKPKRAKVIKKAATNKETPEQTSPSIVPEEKTKPIKEEPKAAPAKKEEAAEKAKPQKKLTEFSAFVKNTKKEPQKAARDLKPKKTDGHRPFDSRFRQGLMTEEDRPFRRRRPYKYKSSGRQAKIEVVRPKHLTIRLPITVKDLAQEMKLKASEIISKLFLQGAVLTINDYLEDETVVELIGHEFGCAIKIDTSQEERLRITDSSINEEILESPKEHLKSRAPIVTFMGHVDHGKTSLIDAARKSNLVSGESGAITQHIGAFTCHRKEGNLTIIDTPGHEAFSLMRERGVTITDIVVLVIAGDEGIKPQTVEAIEKAKEADIPILVALNKCDKEGFNPDNVYRQLADHQLIPEAWGGSTITVNTSATSGEGIENLLEMLALQSEILELKADPSARARGSVIESELHKGLGLVATILVQNGTLHLGDAIVIDQIYGRVKTMHDETGKSIETAGPSSPVKITGLSGLPEAGCEFIKVENEKEARKLCEERASGEKRAQMRQTKIEGIESLLQRKSELSEKKVLNMILRADVQGSIEAIKASLFKIPNKKIELNIISSDVGEISESDIELAHASNAIIVGFHTKVESHAENLIKQTKVIVKQHEIIYHLIDDITEVMVSKLDKIREEHESGSAIVKQTFKVSNLGVIAGCQVVDGILKRNQKAKVFRKEECVWEGDFSSLKRVKEDVREVSKGLECGILLNHYNDLQEDDLIKSYEITYKTQELE